MPLESPQAWVWRHPKPEGAAGRCIGAGTDLPVDRRRAKRLARRIQRFARRHRLPHVVHSSGLQRCADVGHWLRRWGWRHHIDPALAEMDFGAWDGRPWAELSAADFEPWMQDFAGHAPGGGESLKQLLARAAAWPVPAGGLLISHGGWMLARRWLEREGPLKTPSAAAWPAPPRYGECWALRVGPV
ncbi:histidine phosphatase family protein [Kinneretia aquatilis]|uniref:histidine phosphatase family protein n=1 Tax=Kinneretia aquatilis TaxID=2070761 RepID=UPI00149516CA|nr:histidine phosphatase family protein [Paucibacter aquatile]WIV97031.1 histidine phosphatase family protein [Paucibacter aquatile]